MTLDDPLLIPLPDDVIPSVFPSVTYTEEENGTWAILLARYADMIPSYMCDEYLAWFDQMRFPKDRLPRLSEIEDQLRARSDWRLARVHGLTPNDIFYNMLAHKVFPSNDFIRARADIDYTPSPDIFHEVVGHVPMLLNPFMRAYTYEFGRAGQKILRMGRSDLMDQLARIYWFTAEFGLINTPAGPKIFGAGFAPGEMPHALSDQVEHRPMVMAEVAATPYNYWEMQKTLFVIDSFEDMARQFDAWVARI